MNTDAKIILVLNQIAEAAEEEGIGRSGETLTGRMVEFTLIVSIDKYNGDSTPLFHMNTENKIEYFCCEEPEELSFSPGCYYNAKENIFTILRETQMPILLSGKYAKWMKKVIDTVTENIELPSSELVKRISEFEENSADNIIDVKTK